MFPASRTRRVCRSGLAHLVWAVILLCVPARPESPALQKSAAKMSPADDVISTRHGPRVISAGPRTPVNPPITGYHGEVVVSADPESENNIIACGFRADQRTGAAYEGYVYQSSDGGRTWHEVLVDATSPWVSEESCAFGPGHLAYFATGVADTSHGVPQYGHMRLYRSADGGRSWQTIQIDRFMDYMSLAVDTTQGPQRGTLYIFANVLDDGTGSKLIDKVPFLATRRELPAFRFSVTSGNFNSDETGTKFPARYPANSAVLSDGTVLAIFLGDREVADEQTGRRTTLFSVQLGVSRDSGKTLQKTSVYESFIPPVPTGLAVDNSTGDIYVCWTPRYERSEESNLMLGTSRDNGETWTVKSVRSAQGTALDVRAGSVSLAINKEGVLGFMWYGKNGDRAYFGVSADGGDSVAKVIALTPVSPVDRSRDTPPADERRLFVFPPAWNSASNRLEPLKILALGPNLSGVPFGNALVADRGGVFHAVWNEVANGPTSLWTRAISVQAPGNPATKPTLDGLSEISDRVVTHISNVRFDRLDSLVAFDLTVTNKAQASIAGPIVVGAADPTAHLEESAGNADNIGDRDGALWELTIPAEGLECEHSTELRTLIVRINSKDGDELDIPLKIYGKLP